MAKREHALGDREARDVVLVLDVDSREPPSTKRTLECARDERRDEEQRAAADVPVGSATATTTRPTASTGGGDRGRGAAAVVELDRAVEREDDRQSEECDPPHGSRGDPDSTSRTGRDCLRGPR